MISFGPDGGIVSTSKEMLIFLEAFFNGVFFSKTFINEMSIWNKIFSPLKSGIGILLFKLPWLFNPTGTIPELIGHSGLSGAVTFYNPKEDLLITGTVNQVAYPSVSYRLMLKLVQKTIAK